MCTEELEWGLSYEELMVKYREVIAYAVERSDLFCLVTRQKRPYTSRPPICEADAALKPLEPYLLMREVGIREWPGSGTEDHHCVRMVYRACPEAAALLLEMPNLFRFSPGEPEDLHFYRHGEVWFFTIVHEKLAFLDEQDERDVEFFRSNRLYRSLAPAPEERCDFPEDDIRVRGGEGRTLMPDYEAAVSRYAEVVSYAMGNAELFSVLVKRERPYLMDKYYAQGYDEDMELLEPLDPYLVEYESDCGEWGHWDGEDEVGRWTCMTYRCCPEAEKLLLAMPNLLEYHDHRPESLTFYRSGEPWLRSTPFEKSLCLDCPTKDDIRFFRNLGIRLGEFFHGEPLFPEEMEEWAKSGSVTLSPEKLPDLLNYSDLSARYQELIDYAMGASHLFALITLQGKPQDGNLSGIRHDEFCKPLEPYLVERRMGVTSWPGRLAEDGRKVCFLYRSCPEAAAVLKAMPNLLECEPGQPRDLHFYRGHEMWLATVCSARMAAVCSATEADLDFFRRAGVRLHRETAGDWQGGVLPTPRMAAAAATLILQQLCGDVDAGCMQFGSINDMNLCGFWTASFSNLDSAALGDRRRDVQIALRKSDGAVLRIDES